MMVSKKSFFQVESMLSDNSDLMLDQLSPCHVAEGKYDESWLKIVSLLLSGFFLRLRPD